MDYLNYKHPTGPKVIEEDRNIKNLIVWIPDELIIITSQESFESLYVPAVSERIDNYSNLFKSKMYE